MELCVLWLQKKAADIVHHGLNGLRGQTAPQAAAVLGDTDEFAPHQHVQVVGNGALGDAQLLGQLLPAAVLLLQQFQDIQTEFPIVKDTTPNITNSRLNNIP